MESTYMYHWTRNFWIGEWLCESQRIKQSHSMQWGSLPVCLHLYTPAIILLQALLSLSLMMTLGSSSLQSSKQQVLYAIKTKTCQLGLKINRNEIWLMIREEMIKSMKIKIILVISLQITHFTASLNLKL